MLETRFRCARAVCAGHFGNSYDRLSDTDMRDTLAEATFWGYNAYGDWFDMVDRKDPFASDHTRDPGDAWLNRKDAFFRLAQSLGLRNDLVITPNHVYADQYRLPGLMALKGDRVEGQVICPSKPEARAAILRDYENLFADLARSGVRLSRLNAAPYDCGGCRCPQCEPLDSRLRQAEP